MPTITIPGAQNLEVLSQRVYAKLKWEDDWELKEHVHPKQVVFSSSPSVGSATLYYRFGLGRQPGQSGLSLWNPFELPTLAYVRIDIDVRDIEGETETTIHWYGVAGRLVTRRDGSDMEFDSGGGPDPVAIGVQEIYCAAIEWLLDRWPIVNSYTTYRPAASPVVRDVWCGLTFNDGHVANMTLGVEQVPHITGRFVHLYARHGDANEFWNTKDIVWYLLSYGIPFDAVGDYPITWELHDTGNLIPDDDKPILPTDGHHTLSLLNQLLTRQRGYGFRWEISDHALDAGADAKIRLVPFTFVGTELTLPSGAVIKANPTIRSLDVSQDRNRSLSTATDAFSKFHRVIVRGNRMTACFSAQLMSNSGSSADGRPFFANWTSTDEATYVAGTDGDYPLPSEIADQEVARKTFRGQSRWEKVLARFQFNRYWWGWLDTGAAGGSKISFPFPDGDDVQAVTYARGLRIIPSLPLIRGLDYADGNEPTIPDVVHDHDYLQPMSHWQVQSSLPAQYIEGRAIATLAATEVYGTTHDDSGWYSISIHLTPAEGDNQAFDLHVSGDDKAILVDSNSKWDYQDAWVTVAVETPYYAEAQADSAEPPEDILRVKLIHAGSQYRLDWLAQDTILGVDSDRAWITSGAGRYIRDDREKLEDIAKMALTWFGEDRQALFLATSYLN